MILQCLPGFFIGQRHGLKVLLAEPGLEIGTDFGVPEPEVDIGEQVAQFAAAVIGVALHAVGLHR